MVGSRFERGVDPETKREIYCYWSEIARSKRLKPSGVFLIYHLFLSAVFIWCDIFDLKEIKSWLHTCSSCLSVRKLIVTLTAMQGGDSYNHARAPNWSEPALDVFYYWTFSKIFVVGLFLCGDGQLEWEGQTCCSVAQSLQFCKRELVQILTFWSTSGSALIQSWFYGRRAQRLLLNFSN